MKAGNKKLLQAKLVKNTKLLDTEHKVYMNSLDKSRRGGRGPGSLDVIEICGGYGNITRRAVTVFGMKAGQIVDIKYGWDLKTESGYNDCVQYVRRTRPKCLVFELPCTKWCWFNYAVNYADRLDELELLRA